MTGLSHAGLSNAQRQDCPPTAPTDYRISHPPSELDLLRSVRRPQNGAGSDVRHYARSSSDLKYAIDHLELNQNSLPAIGALLYYKRRRMPKVLHRRRHP